MGSVVARCMICGRPATRISTCSLCGARVCSNCYDRARSICIRCGKQKTSRGPDRPGSDDIIGPLT